MQNQRASGPPDVVLKTVAGELSLLQGISKNLEDALLQTVSEAPGAGLEPMKRRVMQDFDLLSQSLDGLRLYLDELAQAAKGQAELSVGGALQTVKLGAMRSRLASATDEEPEPPSSTAASGEVDLF